MTTTTNQPTAAQPIDLDRPVSKITDGDSARSFVAAWHREHFPTDRTFTNYIMGRNKHCALAGDFAWQLAKALESMGSAALARQQPAARVDRIISASGLAEVSVFLESALKVGTVFYAAAPAAPHAQAEPVDQGQVLRTLRTLLDGSQPKDVPGALIVIDHALKNGIAWSYDMSPPAGFMAYVKANYAGDIYFHDPEWHAVRLWNAAMKNIGPRLAAPVPQEAEQAATAAVTDAVQGETAAQVGAGDLPPYEVVAAVNSLRWMLNKSDECDKPNMRATTLLDKHHSKDGKTIRQDLEILWRYFDANRPEMTALLLSGADRAAAPALTDAARDVLADVCDLPPKGWHCTREPGHDGPCAAWPEGDANA